MAKQEFDHRVLDGENVIFIENDHIRLGINLALGGVVTYLAEHGQPNLINSHDWGRQVQMSFYSHPVPYRPEGKDMDETWRYIGWNPIQCGDCYGHRSTLLDYRCENDEIYVKCIPMHWPLDNFPGECTFETWYRLRDNRVEVTARLNNARPDTTQYPARGQELPAVYTNGVWYKLVSYVGNAPFTGGPVTELCTRENGFGWPWVGYCATEHWAALVDDAGYGLGVYNPITSTFYGGFSGEKGVGGPKDANTGYISPFLDEILDHDIVYTYHYNLIVGTLDTIRAQAAELEARIPAPLAWRFTDNRCHFTYRDITDTGLPLNGCLEFSFAPDGALIAPKQFIPAACRRIVIDAAFTGGELPCTLRLFSYDGIWHEIIMGCESKPTVYEIPCTLKADGQRQCHVIDISAAPAAIGFELVFAGAGSAKVHAVCVE